MAEKQPVYNSFSEREAAIRQQIFSSKAWQEAQGQRDASAQDSTQNTGARESRPILLDDDKTWLRVPFQVQFGETFNNLAEALSYKESLDDSLIRKFFDKILGIFGDKKPTGDKSKMAGMFEVQEYFLGRPYHKDTRVGANDAINCIWQFNKDDDILYPVGVTEASDAEGYTDPIGMSRVYMNTTNRNQQILWLSFGVPRFTPTAEFLKNAFDEDLTRINATGFNSKNWFEKLADIFVSVGTMAIHLPLFFFEGLTNWIASSRIADLPTRFFTLRVTMFLYYRYVDSIIGIWMVNAGLYGNEAQSFEKLKGGKTGTIESWTASNDVLPLAMRETGPSIFNIMSRKAITSMRHNLSSYGGLDIMSPVAVAQAFTGLFKKIIGMSEDEYEQRNDPEVRPWHEIGNDWTNYEAFKASMYGATQFVGFRIEKNTDASESFSNSTRQNEIAEKINNMSRDTSAKTFDMGTFGQTLKAGADMVGKIVGSVADIFTSAITTVDVSNLASAVVNGVFVDVPESYDRSDFGKSHNFSFSFRAPYGDPTTIYQTIIVPLALLMAGALPRAAGSTAFQQPFYCRAYSKGLFGIPLGIIDSLSIKRGSSEFGWTYEGIPTCIDVSISIKDLAPAMYMAMDVGYTKLFGANSSFQEYMLTIAGTGLWDRTSRLMRFKQRIQQNFRNLRNQIFSGDFHAIGASESGLAVVMQRILPGHGFPRN